MWKQDKIEEQVCLLLGIGAIGTNVAQSLARLGVKKMIMIDFDVVEPHNLNRQVLFGIKDVGKPKVEIAKRTLDLIHKVREETEIVAHNFDVLTHWKQVIEFVQESHVVFNMIDVGEYFDAAITALCMKLKKPLCMGGSFSQ